MPDDIIANETDPVKLRTHIIKITQQNKIMIAQNNDLIQSNAKLKSDIEKVTITRDELDMKLKTVQDENVKINTRTKDLEEQLKTVQGKFDILEKRLENVPRPISIDNVSTYFKRVIESFNTNLKTDENSNVDFVIGGMDVELKTHVMADNGNNPVISTPNLENLELQKDTINTIKFSIKPIPKERIVD